MADTYDALVKNLRLQWIDTEDALATQRAIIEVTPEAAHLELPRGRRGEKGERGPAANPIQWRFAITDTAQLPTDLDEFDQGAAFPDTVSKSLWIWDGADYFEVPDFIGMKGDKGETPEIAIGTVEMGGTAEVSVNQALSTEDKIVLDFAFPQGPRGEQGEVGPPGGSTGLTDSPDFDDTYPPNDGDAIVWNGSMWAPRTVMSPVGPWIMAPQNFTPHNVGTVESGSVSERLLGTLTIPPLPFDHHPICLGGNMFFETALGIRYDVDVRLNNASTGPLIGKGRGAVFQRLGDPTVVVPYSDTPLSPGSASLMVPANSTAQIYIVARKVEGWVGGWRFSTAGSTISFMTMPVVSL